jgi:TPP-dependent pyruvate/acetoin dehydrogenase alpha subunit
MMAELFGRTTGYCKGKGGSMHIADFSIGILGTCGILGGALPIAAGAGLAARLQGGDQVAVCFFGDGAASEGSFHESLNMASIWKLPVIYVCENNSYADGQDVMAVHEAALEAVERARRGDGPSLIECKTYRYMGHVGGEEILTRIGYRTEDEIEEWKRRDPIAIFASKLVELKVLAGEDTARIEEQLKVQLDEAVSFAEQSPLPAPEEALEDVFA